MHLTRFAREYGSQTLKARKSYRFRAFSQTILFFIQTEKIFFKTSITTCLWFASSEGFVFCFYWTDKIIHIFSDKYFEEEIRMGFEVGISNIENSKIELYRSILINTGHTGGIWCDIRGDEINLFDLMLEEECIDRLSLKYISNRDKDIFLAKWFDLLNICSEDLAIWANSPCKYLQEAPWSARKIEYSHTCLDDVMLIIYLHKFECTSGSKSLFFGFPIVWILYLKVVWFFLFWHMWVSLYTESFTLPENVRKASHHWPNCSSISWFTSNPFHCGCKSWWWCFWIALSSRWSCSVSWEGDMYSQWQISWFILFVHSRSHSNSSFYPRWIHTRSYCDHWYGRSRFAGEDLPRISIYLWECSDRKYRSSFDEYGVRNIQSYRSERLIRMWVDGRGDWGDHSRDAKCMF